MTWRIFPAAITWLAVGLAGCADRAPAPPPPVATAPPPARAVSIDGTYNGLMQLTSGCRLPAAPATYLPWWCRGMPSDMSSTSQRCRGSHNGCLPRRSCPMDRSRREPALPTCEGRSVRGTCKDRSLGTPVSSSSRLTPWEPSEPSWRTHRGVGRGWSQLPAPTLLQHGTSRARRAACGGMRAARVLRWGDRAARYTNWRDVAHLTRACHARGTRGAATGYGQSDPDGRRAHNRADRSQRRIRRNRGAVEYRRRPMSAKPTGVRLSVRGNSVRFGGYRGRIAADGGLQMVNGSTWIVGRFDGPTFRGQIDMNQGFGNLVCTFMLTLQRVGP